MALVQLDNFIEAFQANGTFAPTYSFTHFANRLNGSRCTEQLTPTLVQKSFGYRLQFLETGYMRPVDIFFADLAIKKEFFGDGDATHIQAFFQQRMHAFAENNFGAATADIDHQALASVGRYAVGNSQIDQARLFIAGYNFHRVAQALLCIRQELPRIANTE